MFYQGQRINSLLVCRARQYLPTLDAPHLSMHRRQGSEMPSYTRVGNELGAVTRRTQTRGQMNL